MSRSRSRARHRRQRVEAGLREAVNHARKVDAEEARSPVPMPGNGELWKLLRAMGRAGLCVWDVARAIQCTEDEEAIIAQIVAPRLAGMTRASVIRRREQVVNG